MANRMLRQSEDFISKLLSGEGFGITPEQREAQLGQLNQKADRQFDKTMAEMQNRGMLGSTVHGQAMGEVETGRQQALANLASQDSQMQQQAQMQGLQSALGLGQHQQQYGLQRDQFDFNQEQADREYGFKQDQFDWQQEQADREFDLQQQQFDMQQDQYETQKGRQKSQDIFGNIGTGAAIGGKLGTMGGPFGVGAGTLGGAAIGGLSALTSSLFG